MNIATTHQLAIGYQHKTILNDLSLELPSGQIICLLGANGCGKTTLMRTLLGLLPPISGDIIIADKSICYWRARELAKIVAYVPQAHNTPFAFCVEDIVTMGRSAHLSLLSIPNDSDSNLAQQQLAALGIEHLAKRTYDHLSGGEKQLVLIARALVQQPQLLIMDEPAASLDFGNQIKLLDKIEQLKSNGITILMSTHHPQHASAVADNVILLSHEQGCQQGTPQAMLTQTKLSALYRVAPESIAAHFVSINKTAPIIDGQNTL